MRFVRNHASLMLIVVGGILSLILPFLVLPCVGFLVGDLEAVFLARPWIHVAVKMSIGTGAAILATGICIGLWQGIRNRGRIS
jgi:hypothetical protein